MTKIITWLNQPKASFGLAIFRILFGLIMFWDLTRINNITIIDSFYPRGIIFPYEFIDLPLMELDSMNLLFGVLMLSTLFIVLGLFYRYSMLFFALGFSYFFFLDQVLYNNHLYLLCLISFMMVFMPADAALSLSKKKHRSTIPQWSYRLLQFQIIVVFFFGAIAKINPYWFDYHPVIELLNSKAQRSGDNLLTGDGVKVFLTYAGFLFDLVIGVFILIPKTRKISIVATILFNLTNAYLFNDIYIFPFFMISAMFLFMDQEKLKNTIENLKISKSSVKELKPEKSLKTIGVGVILIYVIIQLILPLRHYGMDGYTDWTGEGQRFAWRMKIQHRNIIESKFALFDTDKKIIHDVDLNKHLYPDEITQMCNSPQMILQFADYIKENLAPKANVTNCWVKSKIKVEFNGLPETYIFDPDIDLLTERDKHNNINDWITPLPKAENK